MQVETRCDLALDNGILVVAIKFFEIYTLCLETTHINMAITKLSAIFATGQVEEMIFASVDRSPHCTQMHYIMHEIERTLKEHAPVKSYVVSDGEIVFVPEAAIDLSKTLSKLADQDM